jgi:hypothetical protein
MTVDDKSPPGAWKAEMERMPWKYSQQVSVEKSLASIRSTGLLLEANILALEIKTLQREVEDLRSLKKQD